MTETNDKTRANIAYLGALNLLCQLVDLGKITEEERVEQPPASRKIWVSTSSW